MTLDDLLAREEIRQLISDYNVRGDRGRVAEMLDAFAPNARLRAAGKTALGHDEIAALLSANPTSPRHTMSRHYLSTQHIERDGETARARTYFCVLTNIGLDHHGLYVDQFARIDGRWLIADREVRLDFQSENSVFHPLPVHSRAPSG